MCPGWTSSKLKFSLKLDPRVWLWIPSCGGLPVAWMNMNIFEYRISTIPNGLTNQKLKLFVHPFFQSTRIPVIQRIQQGTTETSSWKSSSSSLDGHVLCQAKHNAYATLHSNNYMPLDTEADDWRGIWNRMRNPLKPMKPEQESKVRDH